MVSRSPFLLSQSSLFTCRTRPSLYSSQMDISTHKWICICSRAQQLYAMAPCQQHPEPSPFEYDFNNPAPLSPVFPPTAPAHQPGRGFTHMQQLIPDVGPIQKRGRPQEPSPPIADAPKRGHDRPKGIKRYCQAPRQGYKGADDA